jgi:glycosyltransferase involved in cell wall biosynthesis
MTIRELHRSGSAAAPELGASITVLAPRRERLAIVSTRNKLCGIAAYTKALERQLADVFDITVFDLDQYLLRGMHPRVRALGDRHIEEICREIADFDAVNLQLEFGTLGRSAKDIYRRFRRIISAAPRLSITFHTLKRPPGFSWADFFKAIVSLNWRQAYEQRAGFAREKILSERIAGCLRRVQRRKPVNIIVHNRRDLSDATHLHRFRNVEHHPLAFLTAADVEAISSQSKRQNFPLLDQLPSNSKLIGVFGFLNDYKGFGTSIRALYHLSSDYHLLIFGGTHPNEIQQNQPLHPYIASLFRDGYVDTTLYEQIAASPSRGVSLTLDIERQLTDLMRTHPRDLSDRIHFMGAVDDDEFLAGMAICDVVVLPYLEVGQSSSGPISQAVELGCRVIASRTHTFLEFAHYHPNTVEFFDIGNHLELAERIAARPQYAVRREPLRYTAETNQAVYLAANSAPAEAPRFRRRAQPASRQVNAAE